MHRLILFSAFCFLPFFVFSQSPQWRNYARTDLITHFSFDKNEVWISSRSGLVRLDVLSGATTAFQPWNSGLHGLHLHECLADAQGVKWVTGERGGLFRYDDTDWESFFYATNGDSLLLVRSLRANAAGQLWFLSARTNQSQAHACYTFDGTVLDEISLPSTAAYPISAIEVDRQGQLWAVASYELYHFDNAAMPTLIYDSLSSPLLSGESIRSMGFDQDNRLYLGTSRTSYSNGSYVYNSRLLRYDGLEWKGLGTLQTGADLGSIGGMQLDNAGNFWVAYSEKYTGVQALLKFDGSNWSNIKLTDLNLPAGNTPSQTIVTPSGHIWSLLQQTGLGSRWFEYDWNSWKPAFNFTLDPLPSNSLGDVTFDNQQRIWFGGSNTLTRFDGQHWRSYSGAEIGLTTSGFSIWSLNTDPEDGSVWMAFYDNNGDPAAFARQHDIDGFSTFQAPGSQDAFKVLPLPGGRRWVVGLAALGYFNGLSWTWYNSANAPFKQSEAFLDADIDPSGNLWARMLHDTVARFDGANWTIFDSVNMPMKPTSTWVMADDLGNIFTANGQNLLRYDGANWQIIPVSGLPENAYITAMRQDTDQSYWIASNYGVFHWDGASSWTHYHIENSALGENLSYEIKIDPFGNKWFVHNSVGVTVFNPNGIAGPTVGLAPKLPDSNVALNWRLYPNPTSGSARIDWPEQPGFALQIFDTTGRPVRQIASNGPQLLVEGLEPGLYFVCPEGGDCRKLVVLR